MAASWSKKRLSAADFDGLRPMLELVMSERRLAMARMAMVEGISGAEIGRQFDVSRQGVDDAVNFVLNVVKQAQKGQQAASEAVATILPGWEQITLVTPSQLVPRFRAEIAKHLPKEPKVKAKRSLPAKPGAKKTTATARKRATHSSKK
jgi:hypothetical protein